MFQLLFDGSKPDSRGWIAHAIWDNLTNFEVCGSYNNLTEHILKQHYWA